jgi:NAD(P)-dependent dehydrogenase (short-subunit alcohol dehydrogenase family)
VKHFPRRTPLNRIHRTALVTGASTGLGLAITEMLLREDVRVWGTSRDKARLANLAAAYPDTFTPIHLDLCEDKVDATYRWVDHLADGLDLVVNNAGFGVFAEYSVPDFAVWEEQLRVMLLQPARLAYRATRSMRLRGHGAVVNISSLAAEFPLPFQPAYNMAKAGLTALSESLMIEYAETGIVIYDVRPGDYRTDFESSVRRPQPEMNDRMKKAWAAFEKMMRSGPPPEHAAKALHRALLRHRSATLRIGRPFQAIVAPLLARLAPLPLRRHFQASYFDV